MCRNYAIREPRRSSFIAATKSPRWKLDSVDRAARLSVRPSARIASVPSASTARHTTQETPDSAQWDATFLVSSYRYQWSDAESTLHASTVAISAKVSQTVASLYTRLFHPLPNALSIKGYIKVTQKTSRIPRTHSPSQPTVRQIIQQLAAATPSD